MSLLQQETSHPLHRMNVPATLMRNDGSSAPIFHGSLCGVLSDRAVILTGVIGMPFRVGESLIVNANLRNQAIGFVTSVIGVAKKPVPHYYLSFPEGYEDLELRKSIRVPTLIPVRIEWGNGLEAADHPVPAGEGAVVNLNQSGCALSSKNAFDENQSLQISLGLPGRQDEYQLDITIVTRVHKMDIYVHGARFKKDARSDATLRNIVHWLEAQQPFSVATSPD